MTSLCLLLAMIAADLGVKPQAWSVSPCASANRRLYHSRTRLRSIRAFDDDSTVPGDVDDDDPYIGLDERPSDWLTAEFTLLKSPERPTPVLDPVTVATTVVRSLQWVDYPTPNAGLTRCFEFFSWECRKAVTARQGADTLERFVEHGILSPALQPFMGAHRVDLGAGTYTAAPSSPPGALRGALVSFPIVIHGAPIYSLQHMSGMNRTGVSAAPETHMVIRLEEQRRPPLQGCWLVREILDVRHFFAGDMGNVHVGG
jgi:hypothetical protein